MKKKQKRSKNKETEKSTHELAFIKDDGKRIATLNHSRNEKITNRHRKIMNSWIDSRRLHHSRHGSWCWRQACRSEASGIGCCVAVAGFIRCGEIQIKKWIHGVEERSKLRSIMCNKSLKRRVQHLVRQIRTESSKQQPKTLSPHIVLLVHVKNTTRTPNTLPNWPWSMRNSTKKMRFSNTCEKAEWTAKREQNQRARTMKE